MKQNYPNPFNPSTTITYGLPLESNVELKVFTILGQEVATLVNEYQYEGSHTVTFNAQELSGGMYIYRLSAGNVVLSKIMVVTK